MRAAKPFCSESNRDKQFDFYFDDNQDNQNVLLWEQPWQPNHFYSDNNQNSSQNPCFTLTANVTTKNILLW